jgi:hypothetical protein
MDKNKSPGSGPSENRLANLLSNIADTITSFMDVTLEQADGIALWIAFALCFDLFDINPRLAITSPTKRCGKTIMEELICKLLLGAELSSNLSAAAFYTREDDRALLIDEYDSFGKKHPQLRNVINSGYRRGGAIVDRKGARYSTYFPLALASINRLPDTIMDRSIRVLLQRKPAGLKFPKPIKQSDRDELIFKAALSCVVDEFRDEIAAAVPRLPEGLSSDRARDNWEPLFAIAQVAGPEWTERARRACLALEEEPEEDEAVEIIRAIESACAKLPKRQQYVSSKFLMDETNEIGEAEGAEWAPLSKKKLAMVLRLFGVKPGHYRDEVGTFRGYRLDKLRWLFPRYGKASLNTGDGSGTSGTGTPSLAA